MKAPNPADLRSAGFALPKGCGILISVPVNNPEILFDWKKVYRRSNLLQTLLE